MSLTTHNQVIDNILRQVIPDPSRRDDSFQEKVRHTSGLSLLDPSPHIVDLVAEAIEDISRDQTQAKRPSDEILAMKCICPRMGSNNLTLLLVFLQSMVILAMVD